MIKSGPQPATPEQSQPMTIFDETLETTDPEIFRVVQQEAQRQEDHIELIASENYASPAVLAAQVPAHDHF